MAKKYSIESYRKKGTRILKYPPKGYHKVTGMTTAPNGYDWYVKGSLFGGTRERALVKQRR